MPNNEIRKLNSLIIKYLRGKKEKWNYGRHKKPGSGSHRYGSIFAVFTEPRYSNNWFAFYSINETHFSNFLCLSSLPHAPQKPNKQKKSHPSLSFFLHLLRRNKCSSLLFFSGVDFIDFDSVEDCVGMKE